MTDDLRARCEALADEWERMGAERGRGPRGSIYAADAAAALRRVLGDAPTTPGDEREAFVYTVDLATGEFGTRPAGDAPTAEPPRGRTMQELADDDEVD